jgi:hypothetical protein
MQNQCGILPHRLQGKKNRDVADSHADLELLYVATGPFLIFFDEKKQNRLYLEPWERSGPGKCRA